MRYLLIALLVCTGLCKCFGQATSPIYNAAIARLGKCTWTLHSQCIGKDCHEEKDDIYFRLQPYNEEKSILEKVLKQKLPGRIKCLEPNGNSFDKIPLICFIDTPLARDVFAIVALGENICYKGSLTFNSDTSFIITGYDLIEKTSKTQEFRKK